jgi:hypothetical protein
MTVAGVTSDGDGRRCSLDAATAPDIDVPKSSAKSTDGARDLICGFALNPQPLNP